MKVRNKTSHSLEKLNSPRWQIELKKLKNRPMPFKTTRAENQTCMPKSTKYFSILMRTVVSAIPSRCPISTIKDWGWRINAFMRAWTRGIISQMQYIRKIRSSTCQICTEWKTNPPEDSPASSPVKNGRKSSILILIYFLTVQNAGVSDTNMNLFTDWFKATF